MSLSATGASSYTVPAETARSSKFDYVEDWGEKFDGVAELSLHVLDIERRTVLTVPNIDSSKWTVGQPCFLHMGATTRVLVFTAWNTMPRRFGMIYCYQVAQRAISYLQ